MDDMESLTERTARLERQGRWFKRAVGVAAVVVVAAAITWGWLPNETRRQDSALASEPVQLVWRE